MQGMGDQVIRVPVDMLHSLLTHDVSVIHGWEFPRSVDIIGAIQPEHVTNPWIPNADERYGPCVYLRIQHKYCMRRPPGSPLCIEDYDAFLERFRSLAQGEANGS